MVHRFLGILKNNKEKAQSFIELALVLPVILLILLGLIEISFFVSRYLDVMDLTREAARFASIRDPEIGKGYTPPYDCKNPTPFNFYYHTACIFSPPSGSAACPVGSRFCNGLNPLVYLDPTVDDVVIEVFAITGSQTVAEVYPDPPDSLTSNYWAFSDHDPGDPGHLYDNNWKKDCEGNVVISEPHYNATTVAAELVSGSPTNKGFVGVEFFYCYHQVLNLPIANWVVPDPLRIHAYTIMPLPAAQPTPTP